MWENNQLIPPMHDLVMHLIRLPEDQRNPDDVEKARQRLIKEFTIIEEQPGQLPKLTLEQSRCDSFIFVGNAGSLLHQTTARSDQFFC